MSCTRTKAESQKPRTAESKIAKLCALRFTFLASVTSLAVSILVIGCPPAKPEPDEVPILKPEPNEVQIAEPEPNKSEITEPGPNDIEPNDIEPNAVEPNEIKPVPIVSFHDKCTYILTNFVNDDGMVNYKALKRNETRLSKLLGEFAKLKKDEYNSWPREDKIAFWINVYNIQMLKIIVENYPIDSSRFRRLWWPPTSIRHIPPIGVVKAAKWNKYKLLVMDEQFTLLEIEQRFLRKEFNEPRIFFAITQASLSGPPLRNEPYYGHKLDEQLDDQAKRFLSSSRAFRIDRKKRRVYLSVLLKPTWYGKEFGKSKYQTDKKFKDHRPATRAVLNFITNYISEQDVFFLERQSYSVKYIRYDWRLNDSSRRK